MGTKDLSDKQVTLTGTLMNKDTALIGFVYKNGKCKSTKLFCTDLSKYPDVFQKEGKFNKVLLSEFLTPYIDNFMGRDWDTVQNSSVGSDGFWIKFNAVDCVLMNKNLPLRRFLYGKDVFIPLEVYCDDWDKYPFDFYFTHEINASNFETFIENRCIPVYRFNINDICGAAGVKPGDIVEMLEYNHGLSISDEYWFKFPNSGPQTYEELLDWAGLTYYLDRA